MSNSLLNRANDWARRSVTLKLLIVGFLILFLLIPATMLDGLIYERQNLRDSAQREVASKWGLEQYVGGPVVSVPYSYSYLGPENKMLVSSGYAHFLPNEIDIEGTVVPEERYRGIFVVVLYNTKLRIRGRFGDFDANALSIPASSLNWAGARATLGISDMTGVQSALNLQLADTTYSMGPGTITPDLFASGASVPVRIAGDEEQLEFSLDLDLNGSSALYFRPFGRATKVNLQGTWADPSFAGSFLPKARSIEGNNFTAQWEVLELNRNYPQQGIGGFTPKINSYLGRNSLGSEYEQPDTEDRFGVRLLLPVDEYKKTYRSTRFAILFIFITFLTFFFIEVLNRRRVHPIQYLLIGAAIILFYVLLLSISEHLRFNAAYWISCMAIVILISVYSWFILRNAFLTRLVAAVLLVCYLFFYSLLQLQDYALLIGSLGLFAILATIMYLTRNIDWYNLNREVGEE